MSFSTGRIKLNIYHMPNKIKIYLAPKEKRERESVQATSVCGNPTATKRNKAF